MQNNLLQLPVRFQKKGFLYWQICRTDQAAIYEQRVEDGSAVFYEVWKSGSGLPMYYVVWIILYQSVRLERRIGEHTAGRSGTCRTLENAMIC